MITQQKYELFVSLWMAGKDRATIATAIGASPSYVWQLAAHLRKKGVPLPTRPKGRSTADYAALAELAKSLNGKGE